MGGLKRRILRNGFLLMLCFSVVLSLFAGCENTKKIQQTAFVFDTAISITLYGGNEDILNECIQICRDYDKLLSAHRTDSEIYKLNNREISEVSPETADIIEKSLHYTKVYGSKFDITVGSVTELWDFNGESPTVPDAESIKNAAASVGFEKVTVSGTRVTFSDPGVKLDLGAAAKGYVADRLTQYLYTCDVQSAIIDLGGNIVCIREKPDGEKFTVGVQMPFENRGEAAVTFKATDVSVVTSGIYERSFEENGKLYHHILDPKTGMPAESDIVSVTVINKSSFQCDILSTLCFCLGRDKAIDLIESLKDTWCIIIDTDGNITFSDGFAENFEIISQEQPE